MFDNSNFPTTLKIVRYDIGSKVWVYTPKTKMGLTKKLTHNVQGQYRIVTTLSLIHFWLSTLDNHVVSVPVHANHLKPLYDPADSPIDPLLLIDDSSPGLAESDMLSDSCLQTFCPMLQR